MGEVVFGDLANTTSVVGKILRGVGCPQSVRGRLLLMLGVSSLVIALVGGLGLGGTRAGQQSADLLYENGIVTVARLGDLREAFNRMARFEMEMIVNFESPPLTDEAKKQWYGAHQLALQRAAELGSAATSPTAKASIKVVNDGIASYASGMNELVPKVEKGEVLSASVGNQLMVDHRSGFLRAAQALDELQAEVKQATAKLRDDAAARTAWLVAASAIAAAVGLTITLAIGWMIVRSVNSQIRAASALTGRIKAGDLRPDPAKGERPVGEVGALMVALDAMQLSLRGLAAGVKTGAAGVTTASMEIANGSRDLSERTEHAAAHLHQIASTLLALNDSALSSSQMAQHAARLAGDVAAGAQAASASSIGAVSSIQDIRRHSGRIAEITGVIDAIAFQTNLLALNAAVEAAHAGEHGRGFGVVAGEIQVLAKRSADAARDIKGLLQTSKVSVEAGVTAVDRAERCVAGISRVIADLSRLTRALADDSAAQTQRIAAVTRVTAALEGSTQQNSALAEQSTAAADSLKGQAQQLHTLVDVFQV